MIATLNFPIDSNPLARHITRQTGSANQRHSFGKQFSTTMGLCVFADPRSPIIMKTNQCDILKLRERFAYNEQTGLLTFKIAMGPNKKGSVCKHKTTLGYLSVRVDYKAFMVHRIIWALAYGEWPVDQIDHINGIRDDNRLCNLRIATNSQNQCNGKLRNDNSSGVKGVTLDKRDNKWRILIWNKGIHHSRGYFDSVEQAKNVAEELRNSLHGEFARHS